MKPKTIAISIAALLVLILLFQNSQVVSLKIFFWEISMSRVLMFPLLVLVGLLLGFGIGYSRAEKKHRKSAAPPEHPEYH